jgi:TPR repeat protein
MPLPGAPPVAAGDLVDGRYLVEASIGSGGMGVVYRSRHTGTGVACALKLVHPHLVARREASDLFLREARVGGRIGRSPHIVEVIDAGFDVARGVPYLVMELLSGETLEERVAREGALPLPLLCVVLEQIADALEQAHRAGVVHRDLKPGNLFLTSGRRGLPCVKVMDFGIAKVLEDGARQTATQIGTPAYAAPEQMGAAMRAAAARQGITVAATVSPATDVWALGLLAYELATGLPAAQFWAAETTAEIPIKAVLFAHDPASARAGDRAALLPPGFDAWFARATDVDAARRWPTAQQAIDVLLDLLVAAAEELERGRGPAPAQMASYGPGSTEIGATPPPGELVPEILPSAMGAAAALHAPVPRAPTAPIAWSEVTPPPPSVAPTGSEAPPANTGRWSPVSRSILWGGAALAMAGAAGAAVIFGLRSAPTAPEACRTSGERCEEACDGGDAWSCGRLGARHERGEGVPRDEARAAALYQKACDAADPYACAGLGRLYRLGRGGLPRDPRRARALFDKACAVEHPPSTMEAPPGGRGSAPEPPVAPQEAERQRSLRGPGASGASAPDRQLDAARGCAMLGEIYRDGAGVPRDEALALALFQAACARGDPTACKDLGGMHQYGRGGLPRDDVAAAARYREACDGGDVLGCNDLGVLVGAGRGGLPRDERLAADLYERACEGGEMLGCDNLAWMIERGRGGAPADPARAAELYEKACSRGDARGCGNLAVMIERGSGGYGADPVRAAALYQEACAAGDAHACDNLGAMTERGVGGLSRDDARAAALYRSACDAGDSDGCNDLGRLVEAGRGGVGPDDVRASALYDRACEGGALRACVNLGVLLAAGRGGPRDERRAVDLWQRACEGGVAGGCADLGWAYFLGHGVLRDRAHGLELLRRGCGGGSAWGCDRLDEAEGQPPRGPLDHSSRSGRRGPIPTAQPIE